MSRIITLLTLVLKMSSQLADAFSSASIDNNKAISSCGRNNRKLVKSDFTKIMYRAE